MNIGEGIGAALARLGVRRAFGVVGSGNFHVTNGLVHGGVSFVATRHEGGAATMADSYARMSGEVAVLSVHQGCGLTNAITGIGEAAKSRTPLLVVTGEVTDPTSNFHMDQDALARSIGAISLRTRSAATALAEPTLAASVIARAAIARSAVVVEGCAAQTLSTSGGRVIGVVTERGEIRADQVLLAGGLWSRRFLGNHGVSLLTLPLVASVFRTAPMQGPTDIAVGAPDFSFRKRLDGGYTITQRGAMCAPLMLDHLLIGLNYLSMLRAQWKNVRITFGRDFLDDIALPRRWRAGATSPFERMRTMDPPVNDAINAEALRNLVEAWPMFADAVVAESWSGMIDVTPDSLPVIGQVERLPGLTVATGFSGHGFGTAPAAGQLAADLVTGAEPIVDPAPYRLGRFG